MSSKGPVAKRRKVVSAEEFVPIPTLNDDCLVKIFQLLPLRKRIWMEQMCRHWKNDVVPESLRNVKSLEIEDFQANWWNWRSTETSSNRSVCCLFTGSQIFQSIIDRIANQLETISFDVADQKSYPTHFGFPELTLLSSKCPKLKNLVLPGDRNRLRPNVLERLGTELSRLESLTIGSRIWGDTEQNLSVAVSSLPNLKEISVYGTFSGTFLRHLPISVVSVTIVANELEVENLDDFMRSHPGLKKLEMSWRADRYDFDLLCRQTIELLAEHCSQLEQLSFPSRTYGNSNDRCFADAFESLGQLKKVEINKIGSFNIAALESLCANCPQLEDLDISIGSGNNRHMEKPEEFGSAAFLCVGQLEKLKRLKLDLPLVNEGHVDTLMSGVGATLEYLDVRQAKTTDKSLLQIGLKCSKGPRIQRSRSKDEQNLSVDVGLMPNLKEISVKGVFSGNFLCHLPISVDSVTIVATEDLEMENLAEFLRSHAGLKKLELSWGGSYDRSNDIDRLCRQTIGLLAEHCSQLKQLSFHGPGGDVNSDDRSFADAFASLTQLKKVEINRIGSFNIAALESLCASCPQLEDLDIRVKKPEEFGSAAFSYVGQLKKLKSLRLNLPLVDEGLVDTLMIGIGATLEYLDVSEAKRTDASLLQIGLKCSSLAHLRIHRYYQDFSAAGLQGLIDAIVNQESWNDPVRNRRLRVCGCSSWLTSQMKVYGGRVEFNEI